jgi:hypothetical protein
MIKDNLIAGWRLGGNVYRQMMIDLVGKPSLASSLSWREGSNADKLSDWLENQEATRRAADGSDGSAANEQFKNSALI